MSRRYGRNQKRRHREEIARLNQLNLDLGNQLLRAEKFSKILNDDLVVANNVIAEMLGTIRELCPNSVALPPEKLKGGSTVDQYGMYVEPLIDFADVTDHGMSPRPSWFAKTVRLQALRVFLVQHIEDFNLAIHLEYFGGGHSVYMLSEQALHRLPEKLLVRSLAPKIAEELIKYLRNKQGGAV